MSINKTLYKKRNKYISGSQLRNYILDDPIVDILEFKDLQNSSKFPSSKGNLDFRHGVSKKYKLQKPESNKPGTCSGLQANEVSSKYKCKFTQFLFNQGNHFENEINKRLQDEFGKENCVVISEEGSHIDPLTKEHQELFQKTISALMSNTPVIFQPVILSEKQELYGIPDILVKKEFLLKSEIFFPGCYQNLLKESYSEIPDDSYLIIDIKWSSLSFKKNLELSSNPKVKTYFSQITLYNFILKELGSKYDFKVSDYSIIIGRSSKYSAIKINEPSCGLFKIGSTIENETRSAISWRRILKDKGSNWNIQKILSGKQRDFPYDITDPFPNMKNTYSSHPSKEHIAKEISELTNIYYFPRSHSRFLHSIGKYCLQDISETDVPFRSRPTGEIIKKIIDINLKDSKEITSLVDTSNLVSFLPNEHDCMFIDFETVSDIYEEPNAYKTPNYTLITLIGCGYVEYGKYRYRSFVISELTKEKESEMVEKFKNFIEEKKKRYLVHWSSAERTFLEEYIENFNSYKFFDLCKFFIDNKIVIKNCYDFKLKNVANSLYDHGLIKSSWYGNTSPLEMNINFIDCIKKNKKNKEFEEYINYNSTDCLVLVDILNLIYKLTLN